MTNRFLLAGAALLAAAAACTGSAERDDAGATGRLAAPVIECAADNVVLADTEAGDGGNDRFGQHLALLGEHIVVGVPDDNALGFTRAGTVVVIDTAGNVVRKLEPPVGQGNSRMGERVAVSGQGDYIFAGWQRRMVGTTANAGAVVQFDALTGAAVRVIENPDPDASDFFGSTIAVVGTNLYAGAASDDPGGITSAGTVYVFDVATGAHVRTIDNPAPVANDTFGADIAAYRGRTGTAPDVLVSSQSGLHVVSGTSGTVLRTIPNPVPSNDFTGSLAEREGMILVGAPNFSVTIGAIGLSNVGRVYLFDGETGTLALAIDNPVASNPGGLFGSAVAFFGDTLVISAPSDPFSASLQRYDSTTGALLGEHRNPDPSAPFFDQLGAHFLVRGQDFVVGAPSDDVSFTGGSVTLMSSDAAPIASSPPATTVLEDSSATIVLTGSDLEDGTVTFVPTDPLNGTVSGTGPAFVYTPDANFSGNDSFGFTAGDSCGTSSRSHVASITVTPVNDAPSGTADARSVVEDGSLSVAAPGVLSNDTDPENGSLTAVPVSTPVDGTFSLMANGSFTYTPVANFFGTRTFSYKATDGALESGETMVTIDVTPVNDAPVSEDEGYAGSEDSSIVVAAIDGVLANDVDVEGDVLRAFVISPPASGTLSLSTDGSFVYTPAANANGSFSFDYQTEDATLGSEPATVTLTIAAVNDAPEAPGVLAPSGVVSTGLSFAWVAPSDAEGDALTYTVTVVGVEFADSWSGLTGTSLVLTEEEFDEIPDGTYSWSVIASDGELDSSESAVLTFEVDHPSGGGGGGGGCGCSLVHAPRAKTGSAWLALAVAALVLRRRQGSPAR